MSKVGVNHNLCKYVLDKKFRHVPYSHQNHRLLQLNNAERSYITTNAQNTRGRWAIRPRELHNRPRQAAHGGDCKIKNRPRGIIK